MEICEAVPEDNDALKKLQAQCPQGTDLKVSIINTPDFFARAKAHESYKVYVACEGDRIIASHACALRNAIVNSKLSRIGYSFQTFVHPEHRKKNVAKCLLQKMEDHLIQHGAVLVYGLIMDKNLPSIKLVESLGFNLYRKLIMPGIAIRKEAAIHSREKIRSATLNDLTNVAKLLNETWQNHDLYEPASADILSRFISRTPKFSLENLLILEHKGEILACLGFWDWSQVVKLTLRSLNLKMKVIGRLLSITRILPKALKPGDELSQIMLTLIGYKEPKHASILIRYINNIALKRLYSKCFAFASETILC
jgi:GNAT superfamily N-acetyltransferase